jgi:hypothetical protein
MATRVGIELAPDACRIVEIEVGPPWMRSPTTRVRSFAILPPSGPETEATLRTLRDRRAGVVVWTAGGHGQVVVSAGSYQAMRKEATGALAAAIGLDTRGALVDIAPADARAAGRARRPFVVALASGLETTEALKPLVAAGIRVRTVTTPAAALWSLARLRRTLSAPDALDVYVALEERVTCLSMVRSGVLLAARDFGWGYIDAAGSGTEPRRRDEIAARLVDAIGEFVAAAGGSLANIGQVCVCGGLPELRSMTAPLTERLDVEVEPLDSLFGIDAARLPQPVNEFLERSADLRMAWAVAADWPPPINLLRARHRRDSKAMLARAVVAAGVATGLLVGWRVQKSAWWRASTPASAPTPPVATRRPPAPAPAVVNQPAAEPTPAAAPQFEPPRRPAAPAIVTAPSGSQAPAASGQTAPLARRQTASTAPRGRAKPAPAPDAPLPFDAVLGTILYSPDRKLAIVDGRIVAVGDEVKGARVVDITADSVLLRDVDGRLRTLTLGVGGR